MKTYRTQGTCSRAINYEVRDGIVTACEIVGGCPGNTRGVSKLVIGRKVEDVFAMLKGIPCRNGTSCPDQLARASILSRICEALGCDVGDVMGFSSEMSSRKGGRK